MFSKDPHLMTDEELSQWAVSQINDRTPESHTLDYKAVLNIREKEKKERIELCKDVSSFANEAGGVLLYGVPEDNASGTPIPKDISYCGLLPTPNIETTVENILTACIEPPLTELFIKRLYPVEIAPKELLIIYHPASWNKPHMVHGYKNYRYYRRGEFQSVPMKEREIEVAYFTRKSATEHAERFIKETNFGIAPEDSVKYIRMVVCPRFPVIRRSEMLENEFREWLCRCEERRGEWVPFLEGWRFIAIPDGKIQGKKYAFRLYHNGAFCATYDLTSYIGSDQVLDLHDVYRLLDRTVLPYVAYACTILRISGPLCVHVGLHNARGLNAAVNEQHNIQLETNDATFIEEGSVSELHFNKNAVLRRIMTRVAAAFEVCLDDSLWKFVTRT